MSIESGRIIIPIGTEAFPPPDSGENGAKWDKTKVVHRRLENSPFYEEAEPGSGDLNKFKNRHLISRDAPINGGVYVGGGHREAIVVDEKYGELIKVYKELLNRREKEVVRGDKFKHGLLEEVWKLVMEKLPYNSELVERIIKEDNLKDDKKIALDSYINEGGGVCRHQALLGAYLLEKLGHEGKINGHVSVDRNYIPATKRGHAWIRYTNSGGIVFIIDPAQQYIGRLDSADKATRWFYERPEDQKLNNN